MSSRRVPNVSIRYMIPILFVVLITVTVSLIGWLAFRSGKQVVDDLASPLSQETAARIDEHVKTYVGTPHLFHQMNVASVRTEMLDLEDFMGLQRCFWEQAQLMPAVPFVYYGSEEGELLGVEQKEDGSMALWILDKAEDPNLNVYRLDDAHNRLTQLDSVEFDPRIRPWYEAAVQRGGPTWSSIYPDISRPILVITSVMPVYDESGELLGVFGIDLSLGQISGFLRELDIGQTGQAFIIERSGDIVASSANEPPTVETEEGKARLSVLDSGEPLIQSAGAALQDRFGGFDRITRDQQHILRSDGVRQFVQVTPLQDGLGLDWLIVVVVPETDFMGPVYSNVRSNVLLGVLILSVAILVGVVTARYIMQPILAVTDAARAVEAEEFTPGSLDSIAGRTDELGYLTRVFQQMAREIQVRELRLKEQLQQLRIEINEVKRQQQVEDVVETEFFQDLRAKARSLRRRGEGEEPGEEGSD